MIVKFCLLFILSSLIFSGCGHVNENRLYNGIDYAKKELSKVLERQAVHTDTIYTDTLLKDQETVIKVVEPILFNAYGKDKIIGERPYEVYLLNHYWVIMGSMPKSVSGLNKYGGTFIIIIDAMNGKVLKISHGK